MGLAEAEVKERVEEALAIVGLDGEIVDRSPFELSGGQKRRVAIAGVLAMRPKYLILDEPTAGLDPMGRQEILGEISALQRQGVTVVLVSHNMEEVARLVSRLAVMHDGRIIVQGRPEEVFSNGDLLEEVGLALPQIAQLMHRLRERGLDIPVNIYTVEETREAILRTGPKAGQVGPLFDLVGERDGLVARYDPRAVHTRRILCPSPDPRTKHHRHDAPHHPALPGRDFSRLWTHRPIYQRADSSGPFVAPFCAPGDSSHAGYHPFHPGPPVFLSEGGIIGQLGPLKVTKEGLFKGGMMVTRLLLLIIGASLLTSPPRPSP